MSVDPNETILDAKFEAVRDATKARVRAALDAAVSDLPEAFSRPNHPEMHLRFIVEAVVYSMGGWVADTLSPGDDVDEPPEVLAEAVGRAAAGFACSWGVLLSSADDFDLEAVEEEARGQVQ